jgi:hypothetical protein
MEITTNRIINGFLKGFQGEVPPETLKALLSRDVEIVAPTQRATAEDLWPAIWTLAAVLERQLFGRVYVRCGLTTSLPAPAALGSRCEFTNKPQPVALSIMIGSSTAADGKPTLIGDARQGLIAVGEVLPEIMERPFPIECFLLAGYLGFAALATMVGAPEHRIEYARRRLVVGYNAELLKQRIAETQGYTCVGLGQLGQAFLALLFFLRGGNMSGKRLVLIDRHSFESDNGRTQILLAENAQWLDHDKHQFIGEVAQDWGAEVISRKHEIQWGWKKLADDPIIALVGLDDFEVRRMVLAAGFDRLIEAGVGTDLLRPRISWHAVPGNPTLGKLLFPDVKPQKETVVHGGWVEELKQTPGKCGWVRFRDISATAPCMGVAAAAFALSELGYDTFGRMAIKGRAALWSPCLPILRETVNEGQSRVLVN